MTKRSDLRFITARLNLASARLQTSDPVAWMEAHQGIVEAAFMLSDLLGDEDPVERCIRQVLDDPKAGC